MNESLKRSIIGQCFATAAMTGIIWQVQLVTYPQFLRVGQDEFTVYHHAHTDGFGLLVGPLMLAELAFTAASLWQSRSGDCKWMLRGGAALLLVIWLSTAFWQVPLHEQLSGGWSEPAIRELIAGNWLRTLLWSARSALLFTLLWRKS